jgi:hypothetical protein
VTAYIQPLNSVSQGSVNDVERSKGGSVRLLFADKSKRFKFDGGFTRSQYRNPADPLLYQGTNTIAVPFLTRNAHYFDVSYEVLRNFSLTKTRQLSLSVAVRQEQVDPLFKSLGASTQADKIQNEFEVTGNMGEISVQAGNTRFNDNLRRIPTILRSLTRAKRFSIALPAIALVGGVTNKSPLLLKVSSRMPLIPTLAAPLGSRTPNEVGPSRTVTSVTKRAEGTSRPSSCSMLSVRRRDADGLGGADAGTHAAPQAVLPLGAGTSLQLKTNPL